MFSRERFSLPKFQPSRRNCFSSLIATASSMGMLYATLFLVISVFLKSGATINEDNLRNALNSIENRQRQLASNYYVLPNKDAERVVQLDDDNLMYLDPTPPDYDMPHRSRIVYPSKTSPKDFRGYEDDRLSEDEIEEYQKNLNERLLEQLMLDILKNGDEVQSHQRPQKKSFFREREINEVSENLQNLYPNVDADENEFVLPSSFRERVKSKLHSNPHRRVVNPYDTEGLDNDDYLNALNPLWRKYEGVDPETLTNEDMRQFLKYLNDKEFQESDGYNPELFVIEGKERDRSKRYWLGGSDSRGAKYSIQKRSAGFEQTATTEKVVAAKQNTTKGKVASVDKSVNKTGSTSGQKSKVEVKKATSSKRGQQEVPINLKTMKPLNIKKKSIDWSNYFGVDKRQKKSSPLSKEHKNDVLLDQYIQSHILQGARNSAFNNQGNNYRYFSKRNSPRDPYHDELERKLETAEDLKTAEDLIIDHVLKFTGAHDGITDPAEVERFREEVIDELGAAYNLEKLRSDIFDDSRLKLPDRKKKQHHSDAKRVAVKKENAELLPSDLENMKMKHNTTEYGHNPEKKSPYDYKKQLNNINEIVSDECPILYEIVEKCLQISTNVKDRENTFTPFCALHHICDICGNKGESLSCDLSFLADVKVICGDEPLCRYAAQRILHAMQMQGPKSYISRSMCDPCIAEILQYSFEK